MVAARQANMRGFYITLGVVALGGVAAIGFVSKGGPPSVVTLDPNLPPATAEGYVIGSADAKVEIAEFADFQCPVCETFAILTVPDIKKRLVETGLVRYRFYDYPLPQHTHAVSAHLAAACAADQQRFWEMHDKLFYGQADWTTGATNNPKKIFQGYVKELGMNEGDWDACYDDRRHLPRIQANAMEGERLGVRSTPTFRIGDKLVVGVQPYAVIQAYVDSALAAAGSN